MKATGFKRVVFAAVAAMGLSASAANGVMYFDSIEARAGQAIDTGIGASGSFEVECEMEWLSVPADGCFVGARDGENRVYVIYSYDNWSMGYGNNIYGTAPIEPNKFNLYGRTALVTGSTRGIGKAIGDAFEEFGAKVIRHNTKICNLGDPDAIDAWFKTLPPVDILVCNASIQSNLKWYEVPRETVLEQMQVNFNATFRLFQLCYPHMREQKWGRLIVVGSVQERRPHPEMPVYSASKAAQENLVRSVARQVAKEGITVNNLCPGVFFTDRNRDALSDPVYGPKVKAAIPLNDYALPEDAAGTALLLASDAGRYITGATIMVDGGLSLPG